MMDNKSLAILKQYWGFDAFRPLQEEIIQSVLNGRDTLALLPTGGGKSICFQVPAMQLAGRVRGAVSRRAVAGFSLAATVSADSPAGEISTMRQRFGLWSVIISIPSFGLCRASLVGMRHRRGRPH